MEISYAKEHSVNWETRLWRVSGKEGFNEPESIIENLYIWAR